MATSSIRDHQAYAAAIAERIQGVSLPAVLKPPFAAFKSAFSAFESAAGSALKAREARDVALEAVAAADDILDPSVDALATAMVGANLTKRSAPLKGFSSHAPAKLQALAYATEVEEVHKLTAAVLKKKPPSAVQKACALCTKNANAVTAALKKLVQPEAGYNKSLLARDAVLPVLVKATSQLKKYAALAWDEDPATYKAIFAPPDAVQAPKKKRMKKAAPPAPAATPTNGAPPA